MQTEVTVDKGMDADNLNVVVNGFPMEKDVYAYDSQTGDLVVAVSPASVNSIEVTEDESTLSDEILELMEKPEAGPPTLPGLSSGAGMPARTSVTLDSIDEVPTEGWGGIVPVNLKYTFGDGSNDNLENVWISWDGNNETQNMIDFMNAIINNLDTTWYNSVSQNSPFTVCFETVPDEIEFSSFLKQIGYVGAACVHVTVPVEGFGYDYGDSVDIPAGMGEKDGKIYVRVLDRQDNKPERGKATGYIVLGFVTRKAGGQSGNAAIRIDYEAEVKDAVDPIYLYMFKKSVEDVPKIGGAALNGAEYEMLFYSNQHFSSAENAVKKGSQAVRFDTDRIWHSFQG